MIKHVGYSITFQEVPNEVSLVLPISCCMGRCKGCHSPHLRADIGEDLELTLQSLLDRYRECITCVCFMGEGDDPDALIRCMCLARYANLKIALYSGMDNISDVNIACVALCDYIKIGSYKDELGGLNSPTTNQRMYRLYGAEWIDITNKFQKEKR